MFSTARLYHCLRCHTQVVICSECDRGQRYCLQGCASASRTDSLRRAGKKYQASRAGRFNNASRQHRFRQRQRAKVTHQGSPENPSHGVLKRGPDRLERCINTPALSAEFLCHGCARRCGVFIRNGFIRRSESQSKKRPSGGLRSFQKLYQR